jgi:hypothetical protein
MNTTSLCVHVCVVTYFIAVGFKESLVSDPWRWQENIAWTTTSFVKKCTHKLQNSAHAGVTWFTDSNSQGLIGGNIIALCWKDWASCKPDTTASLWANIRMWPFEHKAKDLPTQLHCSYFCCDNFSIVFPLCIYSYAPFFHQTFPVYNNYPYTFSC